MLKGSIGKFGISPSKTIVPSRQNPREYIEKCMIGVKLLINFMIKSIDRIPLSSIELLDAPLSPLKTHVKILKQKLPADFFTKKPAIR